MTRTEFAALLENNNIPDNTFHFENSVVDGYYVLKTIIDGKSFTANGATIMIASDFLSKATLWFTLQVN